MKRMMIKFLLLLALLFVPALLAAQTTVNLSVTDTPDNQTWNNGTWAVTLQMQSGFTNPSGVFTVSSGGGSTAAQNGTLSATGAASFSLPANANIVPGQSTWVFKVCPQATSQCVSSGVIVTTSSPQTVALTPASIRINLTTSQPPISAYTTGEIAQAVIGSQFFLLGTGTQTCSAVSGNSCTTWSSGPPISTQPPINCASSMTFTPANTFLTDFFFNLNCNVTSSTAGVPSAVGSEMTISFTNISPGFNFAWPLNFIGIPPAPVVGGSVSATFQYCGTITNGNCTANSWLNTDQGPVAPPGTTPGGIGYVNASSFGVTGNTQFVCDASNVNTTAVVTTPAADNPFTAADVGKSSFFTNADCQNTANTVPSFIMTQGTILTFTSSHNVTTSTTGSGCTPNGNSNLCVFVWGTPDTTAEQNAWQAAVNACGTLVQPSGGIWLDAPPNATSSGCPSSILAGGASANVITMYGQGQGSTMFIASPTMTFGSTMFALGSAHGGSYSHHFHDFGVASFSPAPAAANNKTGFAMSSNGDNFYNLWFLDYFPSATQLFTPLSLNVCSSCWGDAHDIVIQESGATALSIGGGGSGAQLVLTNILIMSEAAECIIDAGGAGNQFIVINNLQTNNCQSGPFANSAIQFSAGSGVIIINNSNFQIGGGNPPWFNISASGYTFLMNNVTMSQSSTPGTGVTLNIASGSTVIFDGESNSVSAGNTGVNDVSNAGTLVVRNTSFSAVGTGINIANTGTLTFKEGNSLPQGLTNSATAVIKVLEGVSGYTGTGIGTATSASTLGLYGLGQWASPALTSTVTGNGRVMTKAGTVIALYCTAGTAGNQATDACTVVKNHQGTITVTTMTASLNGVTSATDGSSAHAVSFVAGDVISGQVIAGTGTTLANVEGTVVTQ